MTGYKRPSTKRRGVDELVGEMTLRAPGGHACHMASCLFLEKQLGWRKYPLASYDEAKPENPHGCAGA